MPEHIVHCHDLYTRNYNCKNDDFCLRHNDLDYILYIMCDNAIRNKKDVFIQ